MITKEIATTMKRGTILYHRTVKNADKSPARCRVNGKCQTWKSRPEAFKLPVKHGLRDCFYITEGPEAAHWTTDEEEAKKGVYK